MLLRKWQTRSMTSELANVLEAVGPRLRALRRRRETTLTAVAEATGISVSTLSRLESGQRRPTLELLLALAGAYGVALDDLVGAPETGDPRVHMRPITRHDETMIPLTRRPGGVQAYKLIISGRKTSPAPRVHEGYEWLYVLDGELRLILGDQDFMLKPGEAAEFDTRRPHWFGSANGRSVELLTLFGPQGERAHVHPAARSSA
jgi:quercetin dioxygenase-like cupin family protein/DNA-binding XRE family transcriptional regulator